jgi:hypothetical protein
MKFIPVDPTELEDVVSTHRGRVSYPLVKAFLESGHFMAKLDRTGMQQSYQALYSSVSSYIRRHHVPIKMFSRDGQTYFMRLDVDADGNPIPDWEEREILQQIDEAVDLTDDLIDKHMQED